MLLRGAMAASLMLYWLHSNSPTGVQNKQKHSWWIWHIVIHVETIPPASELLGPSSNPAKRPELSIPIHNFDPSIDKMTNSNILHLTPCKAAQVAKWLQPVFTSLQKEWHRFKIKDRHHLASYRTTRSTICSDEGRCLIISHPSWIRFVTQDIKI